MEQNYKRLAAATIAALFIGNIVPETIGMETQPEHREEKVATLSSGQEIRFNVYDPASFFKAFKEAIDAKDFAIAKAMGRRLITLRNSTTIKSKIEELKGSEYSYGPGIPYYEKQLSFAEKRKEFDNTILFAISSDPKAAILKPSLSVDTRLLSVLDSVNDNNYAEQYEECKKILNDNRTCYMEFPEDENIVLERVTPRTEAGRHLKEDLLREYRFIASNGNFLFL